MSFGGFLDSSSSSGGGGGGAEKFVTDIPYNTSSMPTGAIAQPRLLSTHSPNKSMFNSSGLSLALVSFSLTPSLPFPIFCGVLLYLLKSVWLVLIIIVLI